MNEAEKYFLVVTQELNISKAAGRLFVSHQNVSQQIQALETRYGVQLLERKPKLALTPAGQALVDMLTQVRILEQEFTERINEDSASFDGVVSFGMPHPRSYILIPEIVPRYRQRYPNVRLQFVEHNSKLLTERVLRGELDMFIGVQSVCVPQLEYEVLLSEKIYLVMPDRLLRQAYAQGYPGCIHSFRQGVDIRDFCMMPFSFNSRENYIRCIIEEFLATSGVALNCLFECTSQEVQLLLCQRGSLASFCTQMHLCSIEEHNRRAPQEERIHVFPVKGLQARHEVSLAYHRQRAVPAYKADLRDIIRHVLKNFDMLDHGDFVER